MGGPNDRARARGAVAVWLLPIVLLLVVIGGGLLAAVTFTTQGWYATVLVGGVTLLAAISLGVAFVGALRRRAGRPAWAEEPSSRSELDADGRVQDTEPGARIGVVVAPALIVVAIVVAGWLIVQAVVSGDIVGALVVAAIAALFIASCWMGFLQSRRALRSDAADARERGTVR